MREEEFVLLNQSTHPSQLGEDRRIEGEGDIMRLTLKGVLVGVCVLLGGAAFAARERVSVDRFAQLDKDNAWSISQAIQHGDPKAAAQIVSGMPTGSCVHSVCSKQVSVVLARIDVAVDRETAQLVSRSAVLTEKQRLRVASIIERADRFRDLRNRGATELVAKLEAR